MPSCKLTIKDEVNIKFEGLSLETRRKLANKFKFEVPWARYQPAYRLGRWDGTVAFFGIGGTGYMSHIEECIDIVSREGYDIEVEDLRTPINLEFKQVTENYWADMGKVWPKGHIMEGKPIVLRDYQYEAVNKFLENPQCLQEIATGAGKTITTATLSHCCEKYGRTVVIVPNKSLVEQTEEDFRNLELDVGVYYGDRKELNKTHTICTWQSLAVLEKDTKAGKADISIGEFVDGVVCIMVDECFAAGTLVLTPTGYRPIESFQAGDLVINYCEKTHRFKTDTVVKLHTNLTHSAAEKMYEILFDNNRTVRVTGNHKFLTTNRGWVRADELNEHDDLVENINT